MILDIVAGSILLISVLIAWFRGFIRETLTILGLIGAAIASLFGGPAAFPFVYSWFPQKAPDDETEPMLMGFIPYDAIAIGLSYVLVFIIVYIILSLFSHWLAQTAKELGLGALDRSLGIIFGLARAVIIIGFLFIPFNMLLNDEEKDEWFGEAVSLPYVNYTARVMRAAIPSPVQEGAEEAEDVGAAEEEDGDSREGASPLDILQRKAIQNMEEGMKILQDTDKNKEGTAPSDAQESNGYSDQDRKRLEQLFQQQDDNGTNSP